MSKFEIYKGREGDFRFRLRDSEGKVVASSAKGYANKNDCLQLIESVKKEASAESKNLKTPSGVNMDEVQKAASEAEIEDQS